MPIGEFIGEVLLRGVFEIIFYTLAYYTGAMALWIVTLGQIRLAPLTSIDSTNRKKNRWTDWSIWLHRGAHGKALKAECTCLVGMLVWVAIGFGIYFITREDEEAANKAHHATTTSRSVSMISSDYNPNPVIDARRRW
jgi:uncharacterized iron-regulated membrane protein